jgi:hypothetical protein
MGAVYAQFTTPFEIKDRSMASYERVAYLRMPRDGGYVVPSPDRPSRGWVVLRHSGGTELFRADVNLFMDGGVGVAVADATKLADVLVGSTAVIAPDPERAAHAIDAILQRLEAMHSPWAVVQLGYSANGIECFHEDRRGQRTAERYVVDLRLQRQGAGTSY